MEEQRPAGQTPGVQIRAQVTTQEGTFDARTRDINRRGICILCAQEVQPGSLVQLSLSLLLGNNSASEDLRLTARVLWCTPLGKGRFQLGGVFTGLDLERLGYLDMFLRLLQQELVLDLRVPGN